MQSLNPTIMQKLDLQGKSLSELQELLLLNEFYLKPALVIAQNPKQAIDINAMVWLSGSLDKPDEKSKTGVYSLRFALPDEVPDELKTFFADYSTRLLGEKWMLLDAINEIALADNQNSNVL